MSSGRSFVSGFVAGVALCVAPASFVLVQYSGASSWLAYPYFALLSLSSPWRQLLALL